MTYDEWMNEIESYGTRKERFLNEWDHGMSDKRMEEWLKAAYIMGFNKGYETGTLEDAEEFAKKRNYSL